MRTIERSTAFKRDFKRELKGQHRNTVNELVATVALTLAQDKDLDHRYHDHDLTGNWHGYRECHIKPDLLLIYKKISTGILGLARLGSHSELF